MAIRFLTDSTADIRPEEGVRRDIEIVPLKLQFGDYTYLDGLDLDHKAFYEKLAEAEELPTTSQASPDDFLQRFEAARDQGDTLICVLLAAALSGTCQSARIAQSICGYENIYVVDSTQTVLGLRLLLDAGIRMRDAGLPAEKIVSKLEEMKGRVRLLAVVDTLEYLHKGGRLPAAVTVVGGLLKVKPVITLDKGAIRLVGKGMGTKGSIAAVLKCIGANFNRDPRLPVYYGYTATDTLCTELKAQVEKAYGVFPCEVHSVGAVIGTHVGPNAAVVVYLELGEDE